MASLRWVVTCSTAVGRQPTPRHVGACHASHSACPSLRGPVCSPKAQNGFSTEQMHLGPIPRKWLGPGTRLETFQPEKGLSKYPPSQLLSTGLMATGLRKMFFQIKGPVLWPSGLSTGTVIGEAAKGKKPSLDH